MFHIQGPVGSGKTTGIRALCVLFSLHSDGNILICTSQNAPCDKLTKDMYEASQQCNINVTRIASNSDATKHTEMPVDHGSCGVRAGRRSGQDLLPRCKTNVVILTFGMTGKAVRIQRTIERCLPTEQFHLISADEKQNENGENLLLLP